MAWTVKWKNSKDRPADTDMHDKQHARAATAPRREANAAPPGPLLLQPRSSIYFSSDGVPCLFLPPEGSLGKAAACPGFFSSAALEPADQVQPYIPSPVFKDKDRAGAATAFLPHTLIQASIKRRLEDAGVLRALPSSMAVDAEGE